MRLSRSAALRVAWRNPTIAAKASLREWLTTFFELVEDVIYVGLGFLIAAIATTLLISEIAFFAQFLVGGKLSENIVMLLDRILLIIIFAEVLYTVQVSFRQRVLQPGPFLVVSLIAATRRILVLTAELPEMAKDGGQIFFNAMIELGLLTVLLLVLVVSLHYLKPASIKSAVEEDGNKKK